MPSRCNGKRASSVVIMGRQENQMMRVLQSVFDGEANSRMRVKLHHRVNAKHGSLIRMELSSETVVKRR